MKDFLQKYREKKILSNMWILFASLVLALWINFFVIDSTNFWNWLKADVLNSNLVKDYSDIYISNNLDKISIKNSKKMENVEKLSIWLIHNPENVDLKFSSTIDWINIKDLSEVEWVNSLIIYFSWNKNIDSWTNLIDIKATKKINKPENINLINASFMDNSWTDFGLTTSGINF